MALSVLFIETPPDGQCLALVGEGAVRGQLILRL